MSDAAYNQVVAIVHGEPTGISPRRVAERLSAYPRAVAQHAMQLALDRGDIQFNTDLQFVPGEQS